CSSTLNAIDQKIHQPTWKSFLGLTGNKATTPKVFERDDLDEVSEDEMGIVTGVWNDFGHMTAGQLRTYTHKNCPEYTETKGRIPISYKQLLEASGASEATASKIEREIARFRREESALTG